VIVIGLKCVLIESLVFKDPNHCGSQQLLHFLFNLEFVKGYE